MTDLTSVIALIATLVTAFVIPWLRRNTSIKDRDGFLKSGAAA